MRSELPDEAVWNVLLLLLPCFRISHQSSLTGFQSKHCCDQGFSDKRLQYQALNNCVATKVDNNFQLAGCTAAMCQCMSRLIGFFAKQVAGGLTWQVQALRERKGERQGGTCCESYLGAPFQQESNRGHCSITQKAEVQVASSSSSPPQETCSQPLIQ